MPSSLICINCGLDNYCVLFMVDWLINVHINIIWLPTLRACLIDNFFFNFSGILKWETMIIIFHMQLIKKYHQKIMISEN